jgi:hypothetical protein
MGGEGARVAGSANTADPGTLEGNKPTVRGSRFIHSPTPYLENYQFRSDVDITLNQEPEFIHPTNSKNTKQTALHYVKKKHYEEQNNKQLL